jgi:hypothetical protein
LVRIRRSTRQAADFGAVALQLAPDLACAVEPPAASAFFEHAPDLDQERRVLNDRFDGGRVLAA